MLELLREVEAQRAENGFLGDLNVKALRSQAGSLRPDAPPEQGFGLLGGLGMEELRLGNTDAAIERLEAASALVALLPDAKRRDFAHQVWFYLGLAHLRRGETQNCVARHTSDSCILPIREGGIHANQEGSRKAIEQFTKVLESADPGSWEHTCARWLLNIAAMTIGLYPDGVRPAWRIPPSVFTSDEPFPRFVDVAPRLGLNTIDLSGGAIVEDLDGDRHLDILVSTLDTAGPMHFFHNNADGTFDDRTEEAGLTGLLGGLNMVDADYDNDGDVDVLVLRGAWFGTRGRHPRSLLRNNGDGTFTDVTLDAGLGEAYPSQAASWGDHDGDGDLDLYIGNEAQPEERYPSQLFRNNGDGTFTDIAREAGVENRKFAKAVVWGDYDGDRRPDLYVSNLRGANRLYHNNGDGTFTDVAKEAGVTLPIDSFPAWFFDFDNDGNLDIYVASYLQELGLARLYCTVASYLSLPYQAELGRLYRGDGKGHFDDVTLEQGLTRFAMPMGANFGDLDNDGYLDFYLGTGYPAYDGLVPNLMYRNRGGKGFADVSFAGGFAHLQKGHAVAFADLNNDGDQEIFEQMGGAYPGDAFGNVLYESPGFGHHWLSIQLVGVRSNRSAVGARIRAEIVEDGKRRSIYRWVNTGGSFGCNPLRQTLGLGTASRVEVLEVFWPTTGLTQTFREVAPDRLLTITEGSDRIDVVVLKSYKLG